LPYSMTGYGSAEGAAAGGRLRAEIRTVNHRFFNFAPKLPGELLALEGEVRERLRQEFDRGHISLQLRWVEQAARDSVVSVDLDRAREVASSLWAMQAALGLGGEVTVDMVARQPEVLGTSSAATVEVSFAEVEPILAKAAEECRAMRHREGAALALELELRLGEMERAVKQIAELAPARLVRERERLGASVAELLNGRSVDDARLSQELAFLADKLDITEELVRFRAHLAAARAALAGDRPVGKQLGFLAQELGREVNTMGSKANDAEIAQLVIAMKGELEKFREQLENLE
jgi:uncharacterized protein (TIGR00255 family)